MGHTGTDHCCKNRTHDLGRTRKSHNHYSCSSVVRWHIYLIYTNRFAWLRHVYSWCRKPRSYGMLPLLGLLFCYPLESGECQSWCESNSPMKVFSLYIISMMRYYKMVLMFNLYLVRPKATSALYGEEDLNLLLQQCSCHPLNHLSCIPESLLEHHIPITGTNILVSS